MGTRQFDETLPVSWVQPRRGLATETQRTLRLVLKVVHGTVRRHLRMRVLSKKSEVFHRIGRVTGWITDFQSHPYATQHG